MTTDRLVFRVHAIQRMVLRDISEAEVRVVLTTGEAIEEYLDDTPYPSRLVLGWVGSRPSRVGGRLPQETSAMKCVVCKHGTTRPGRATITLERGGATLVIKGVPAEVCGNCEEEYVGEETTARLLRMAEEAAHAGVQVDVREYVAA
jgi:YgiT-type zinc finger domain-containing protein